MTPIEFKEALKRHFKTYAAAAKYLGVNQRTIFYYLSGHTPIPQPIELILQFLEKVPPLPTSEVSDTAPKLEE